MPVKLTPIREAKPTSSLSAAVQIQHGLWVSRCQEHSKMAGTHLGKSAGLRILGVIQQRDRISFKWSAFSNQIRKKSMFLMSVSWGDWIVLMMVTFWIRMAKKRVILGHPLNLKLALGHCYSPASALPALAGAHTFEGTDGGTHQPTHFQRNLINTSPFSKTVGPGPKGRMNLAAVLPAIPVRGAITGHLCSPPHA